MTALYLGYYCPIGSASSTEKECQRGYYCDEQSPSEKPCPEGTYNDQLRAEDITWCKTCPAG